MNLNSSFNPSLRVIRLSAVNGEGMSDWLDWIKAGYHQVMATKVKIDNSQHYVD